MHPDSIPYLGFARKIDGVVIYFVTHDQDRLFLSTYSFTIVLSLGNGIFLSGIKAGSSPFSHSDYLDRYKGRKGVS